MATWIRFETPTMMSITSILEPFYKHIFNPTFFLLKNSIPHNYTWINSSTPLYIFTIPIRFTIRIIQRFKKVELKFELKHRMIHKDKDPKRNLVSFITLLIQNSKPQMINLYKYQMQVVLYSQVNLFHRSTQQNDRTKKSKRSERY